MAHGFNVEGTGGSRALQLLLLELSQIMGGYRASSGTGRIPEGFWERKGIECPYMSIAVLSVASSSNCCAPRAKLVRRCPARAAVTALSEYFPPSPPFLRAVMGNLPRWQERPPVALALRRVVPVAKCSVSRDCQEAGQRRHRIVDP